MERFCDLETCEDYRGFEVGYCHRFMTIMNSQEKKDFFAINCEVSEAQAVREAWEANLNMAWEPES